MSRNRRERLKLPTPFNTRLRSDPTRTIMPVNSPADLVDLPDIFRFFPQGEPRKCQRARIDPFYASFPKASRANVKEQGLTPFHRANVKEQGLTPFLPFPFSKEQGLVPFSLFSG